MLLGFSLIHLTTWYPVTVSPELFSADGRPHGLSIFPHRLTIFPAYYWCRLQSVDFRTKCADTNMFAQVKILHVPSKFPADRSGKVESYLDVILLAG